MAKPTPTGTELFAALQDPNTDPQVRRAIVEKYQLDPKLAGIGTTPVGQESGDSTYQKFKDFVLAGPSAAYDSAKSGLEYGDKLGRGIADTEKGAYDKFREVAGKSDTARAVGEVGKDALFAATLGPLGAPVGKGVYDALTYKPKLSEDKPMSDEEFRNLHAPAGSIDFAPRSSALMLEKSGLKAPGMTSGLGVGGGAGAVDSLGGRGTDSAIMGDQDAILGDIDRRNRAQANAAQYSLDYQNAEASTKHEIARLEQNRAAEIDRINFETDRDMKDTEQKWYSAVDEVSQKGIDPGRMFKNRDMGFWFAMAIGAVSSGMLSAMQGQAGNPFMDSVRQMVQEDIKSQEEDIQQGWRKAKGMETAYERARVRGVDRVVASAKQYDHTLAAMQSDISARLQTAKIPEMRQNLMAALESIQMERDQVKMQQDEYWKNVRGQRAAAAAAAAERAWRHGMEMKRLELDIAKTRSEVDKNEAEAGKLNAEAGKEGNKLFIPTGREVDPSTGTVYRTGITASSPEEHKAIANVVSKHDQIMSLINESKEIRNRIGMANRLGGEFALPGTVKPWEVKLEANRVAMMNAVRQGTGMGAYDEGVQKLMEGMLGDPNTINSRYDIQLDQLAKGMNDIYSSTLSAGGPPAAQVYDPETGQYRVFATKSGLRAPTQGGDLTDLKRKP